MSENQQENISNILPSLNQQFQQFQNDFNFNHHQHPPTSHLHLHQPSSSSPFQFQSQQPIQQPPQQHVTQQQPVQQPSSQQQSSNNTQQLPPGNPKARARNLSANGTTVASQADDEKYITKFREMKKKTKEAMNENDKLYLKLLKTQWSIKRAKMFRSILYERLENVKRNKDDDLINAVDDSHSLPSHNNASNDNDDEQSQLQQYQTDDVNSNVQ